jgi:hypothetical protein
MAFYDFSDHGDLEFRAIPADSEVLPEGFYAAAIIKIESQIPRSGGAPYLNIEFKIEKEPSYALCPFIGRRTWRILSFQAESEMARTIAKEGMIALLKAVGAPPRFDERELMAILGHQPLYIQVAHELDKQKGIYRDRPTGFFGRAQHTGKHAYGNLADIPSAQTTITGNAELCAKAIEMRNRKLARSPGPGIPGIPMNGAGTGLGAKKEGNPNPNHPAFQDLPF